MWKRALDRPLQGLAVVLLVGCMVSVAGVGLLAWSSRERLQSIRERIEHANRLEIVGLRAQQSLLAQPQDDAFVDPLLIANLRNEIQALHAERMSLDPTAEDRFTRLELLLDDNVPTTRPRLVAAVALLGDMLSAETAAQGEVWQSVDHAARTEMEIVLGVGAAVPVLALLLYGVSRRRLIKPLVDLRGLLSELAGGERRTVRAEGVHPVLLPLFENYNRLVTRLAELEEEHSKRARSLEEKVRAATETLLEQQMTLARAERLAAVGETAAGLAHEVRNPLAAIRMSLSNLRTERCLEDFTERFDLIIAEIDRLGRLLDGSLAAARHTPERPRSLNVRELVSDLLSLLRFQLPEQVELESDIPDGLECSLPRDRFRQALLNLVLNSVHAIGPTSGRVVISARERDGALELEVCDSGPGFPAEVLRSGVHAFSTGGSSGTGLGLAMVRRVAVDLGGDIALDNPPPHGARVRMRIPCSDG